MKPNPNFQIHGHRGCRGLLPENTIPAFGHANKLGVDAIELDVVISKDREVIVSHEPYFSHHFSTDPHGNAISKWSEKKHNLYQLTTEEIQTYDVGARGHAEFASQKELATNKPTLKEAVSYIDNIRHDANQEPMHYSIEIKRKKKWDDKFHPKAEPFVDLVLEAVTELQIRDRMSLLCFDLEVLEFMHKKAPDIELVYLVDNFFSVERNMKRLSFKPDVYGPKHSLLNKKTVSYCKANDIDIVCWTANTVEEMKNLINLGVTGITTDYPDRLIGLRKRSK